MPSAVPMPAEAQVIDALDYADVSPQQREQLKAQRAAAEAGNAPPAERRQLVRRPSRKGRQGPPPMIADGAELQPVEGDQRPEAEDSRLTPQIRHDDLQTFPRITPKKDEATQEVAPEIDSPVLTAAEQVEADLRRHRRDPGFTGVKLSGIRAPLEVGAFWMGSRPVALNFEYNGSPSETALTEEVTALAAEKLKGNPAIAEFHRLLAAQRDAESVHRRCVDRVAELKHARGQLQASGKPTGLAEALWINRGRTEEAEAEVTARQAQLDSLTPLVEDAERAARAAAADAWQQSLNEARQRLKAKAKALLSAFSKKAEHDISEIIQAEICADTPPLSDRKLYAVDCLILPPGTVTEDHEETTEDAPAPAPEPTPA